MNCHRLPRASTAVVALALVLTIVGCSSEDASSTTGAGRDIVTDDAAVQTEVYPQRVDSSPVELTPSALFERITQPELLVERDVRDIVQDRNGFMWFGLREGDRGALVRYDGYEAVTYRHDPDDERSITDNSIWMLDIDRDGALWVGTVSAGLQRYDVATDDFTRFMPDPTEPTSMPSLEVKSMLDLGDGVLWFTTSDGLVRFDKATEAFELIDSDRVGLPDVSIRAIAHHPATDELWLGTRDGGVSVYNMATNTFRNYSNNPDDRTSLPNNSVDHLLFDADGTLWVGTRGGLARYNPDSDDFTVFRNEEGDPTSLGGAEVTALMEDSQGRMWVGHESGLDLFDRTSATAMHFVHRPEEESSVPAGQIRSVVEDDFGAIWVSTIGGGIGRLSPLAANLTVHRHDPTDPTTISSDTVRRVLATDAGVMVSGPTGADLFDGETFERLVPQPIDAQPIDAQPIDAQPIDDGAVEVSGENDGETVSDKTPPATTTDDDGWAQLDWPTDVISYLADADRNVWMTAGGGDIVIADRGAETITRYPGIEPDGSGGTFWLDIQPGGRGWFIVGGYGPGVFSDGEFFAVDDQDPIKTETEEALSWAFLAAFDTQRDIVWVGGEGLFALDAEANVIGTYYYDPEQGPSPDNVVSGFVQQDDGIIWLASNVGLHRFNPDTGTYEATYVEGLPSRRLRGLAQDADGRLWSMSENSFVIFDPNSEEFSVVAPHEGIADLSARIELAIGPDGTVYTIAEEAGLIAFDPDTVRPNPVPADVRLTGVDLFGIPVVPGADDGVLPVAPTQLEELRLAHDQNYVSFEFTSVAYEHPDLNRFQYRLLGLDDDWIETTPDARVATYTNLASGEYVFEVRAANNSGVWNPQPLRVPVTIATPWWAHPVAYVIYLLTVVAAVALFIKWRVSAVERRNGELKQQLEERRRAQEEKDRLIDALEVQAERVQGVMDATPTAIMLLDRDRSLVTANRVAVEQFDETVTLNGDRVVSIAGLAIDEYLGTGSEPLPQHAPHEASTWRPVSVFDDDGEGRHFIIATRALDATSTNAGGWVVVFDDVTEQRNLQEEAERQRQLATLGRFAAGIAHDVNNVLTAIGLNVDLLQMGGQLDPEQRHRVDLIGDQTRRADLFIAQVLDYSRRSVTAPEITDLGRLVEEQLDSLAVLVPKDIRLEVSAVPDAFVLIDPTNAEQVVLNLVMNARDAVPAGGTISVFVETSDDPPLAAVASGNELPEAWVRLTVADDGVGIPADVIDSIFDPFFTTKRMGEGTGLGLAQVGGIAQQNGGYVEVDSIEGVGSTLRVYLPAIDGSVVQPALISAGNENRTYDEVDAPTGHGQTVLIVDDDPAINEAMAEILTQGGYRTMSAFDGADVLTRWDELATSVDLIVTDLVMPNMGGNELATNLRRRRANVPIIGVSGVLDDATAGGSTTGVNVWMRKPIKRRHLLVEVSNALKAKVPSAMPTTPLNGRDDREGRDGRARLR